MKTFKAACVQMNALKDDLDHNLQVHVEFIRRAAKAQCHLILFPELSTTAHYGDEEVARFAEPVDRGVIFATMQEQARKYGIVVSYGLCEKAHGTHYNAQVLMGPEGILGVQRKVHASKDEYFTFRMGRSLEVFDIGLCRIGTLICYDTAFSEAWRVLALKGAEVLLLPHASRSGWGEQVPPDAQVAGLRRALKEQPLENGVHVRENGVFALYCNQVDFNGHSTHAGGAFILDPGGHVQAKSRASLADLMITAELDPQSLERVRRSTHHTLKTRRPEVYGEVTRMI